MLIELGKQLHEFVRGFRVEIGRRLVGEHQLGPRYDRARHGDALLLAAGHLGRPPILQSLEADFLENRDRLLARRSDAGTPCTCMTNSMFSCAVSTGIRL